MKFAVSEKAVISAKRNRKLREKMVKEKPIKKPVKKSDKQQRYVATVDDVVIDIRSVKSLKDVEEAIAEAVAESNTPLT